MVVISSNFFFNEGKALKSLDSALKTKRCGKIYEKDLRKQNDSYEVFTISKIDPIKIT